MAIASDGVQIKKMVLQLDTSNESILDEAAAKRLIVDWESKFVVEEDLVFAVFFGNVMDVSEEGLMLLQEYFAGKSVRAFEIGDVSNPSVARQLFVNIFPHFNVEILRLGNIRSIEEPHSHFPLMFKRTITSLCDLRLINVDIPFPALKRWAQILGGRTVTCIKTFHMQHCTFSGASKTENALIPLGKIIEKSPGIKELCFIRHPDPKDAHGHAKRFCKSIAGLTRLVELRLANHDSSRAAKDHLLGTNCSFRDAIQSFHVMHCKLCDDIFDSLIWMDFTNLKSIDMTGQKNNVKLILDLLDHYPNITFAHENVTEEIAAARRANDESEQYDSDDTFGVDFTQPH